MRTTTFNMSVALSAFRLAASFAWQPSRLSHLQFVQTMTTNIEALTGSPVAVTLTNYTGGSVVVTTQTAFEDNDAASAAQYANVMKSGDPTLVFGTGYGSVTVDPSSVTTGQATNPARKSLLSFMGSELNDYTMSNSACNHKKSTHTAAFEGCPLQLHSVTAFSLRAPSLCPILTSGNLT